MAAREAYSRTGSAAGSSTTRYLLTCCRNFISQPPEREARMLEHELPVPFYRPAIPFGRPPSELPTRAKSQRARSSSAWGDGGPATGFSRLTISVTP